MIGTPGYSRGMYVAASGVGDGRGAAAGTRAYHSIPGRGYGVGGADGVSFPGSSGRSPGHALSEGDGFGMGLGSGYAPGHGRPNSDF